MQNKKNIGTILFKKRFVGVADDCGSSSQKRRALVEPGDLAGMVTITTLGRKKMLHNMLTISTDNIIYLVLQLYQ